MKRVLITGMSGTGKSTLIREIAAAGHKAVDTDDDWPTWVTLNVDGAGEQEWVWREDLIERLLSTEDSDTLFVSGCVSNQGKFYPRFDHVILLTAPTRLIVERLQTRTTNPYGKRPGELARVLGHKQSVEPLLRKSATFELDTSVPIDQVVAKVLELVEA